MTSLSASELRTIYETIRKTEQVREKGVKSLADLFAKNPRLIISPNNQCNGSCLHCVADSTHSGITMPYEKFAGINPEFFRIFSAADFGRRGNPLLYHSNSKDLVDLMTLLNENGINKFTLALALQNSSIPVIGKMEEFAKKKNVNIEIMVTYHHYYPDLDKLQLAKDFNSTLINYLGFSKKIIISLLGDQYSQQEPTKAEEVQEAFLDNHETIFAGIKLTSGDKEYTYHAQHAVSEAEIKIPPLDTRVYPLGRFRQYLAQRGVLEQYGERFEQGMGDYVCPDLIKWPGIIIEPDGSLNLCASFEAVACKRAIVSNVFTKSYSEVQEELTNLHKKEMRWFIDNLSDIIVGKVSTCKLKNKCYEPCNR